MSTPKRPATRVRPDNAPACAIPSLLRAHPREPVARLASDSFPCRLPSVEEAPRSPEEKACLMTLFRKASLTFPENERILIDKFFGLTDDSHHSHEELARMFRIAPKRFHEILVRVCRKLQRRIRHVKCFQEDLDLLLPEDERLLLEARFGLTDGIHHSREEVGRKFQVSHARICQIEARTFRKLLRRHRWGAIDVRGVCFHTAMVLSKRLIRFIRHNPVRRKLIRKLGREPTFRELNEEMEPLLKYCKEFPFLFLLSSFSFAPRSIMAPSRTIARGAWGTAFCEMEGRRRSRV